MRQDQPSLGGSANTYSPPLLLLLGLHASHGSSHCLNSVMTLSPERSPKTCCFRDTCSAESDSPLDLHQLGPRSPSSGPSGSWLSTRLHSLSNTQHTVQKMVEASRLFTNRSAHQSPGRLGHLPGPLTHGLIQDADRVWHQEHLRF